MSPKSKVTEIYCMTDDFCKGFTLQQAKYIRHSMTLLNAGNVP